MALLSMATEKNHAVCRTALFAAVLLSGFGAACAEDVYRLDWVDAEGDDISLKSEKGHVNVYCNGHLVVHDIRQVEARGLRITFCGPPSRLQKRLRVDTQVPEFQMAWRVQNLVDEHNTRTLTQLAHSGKAQQEAEAPSAVEWTGNEVFGDNIVVRPKSQQSGKNQTRPGPQIQFEEDLEHRPALSDTLNHVLHLGRHTFSQTVLPSTGYPVEHWIVLFCYSWYKPCQDIEPFYTVRSGDWEAKLNQDIFTNHVRFAKVDCAADKELCNAQGVDAYPFVKHYSEGAVVAKWAGGHEGNDEPQLAMWLNQQLEGSRKPEVVFSVPSVVTRLLGVDVIIMLGLLALTFRADQVAKKLWKVPTDAPVAAVPRPLPEQCKMVTASEVPSETSSTADEASADEASVDEVSSVASSTAPVTSDDAASVASSVEKVHWDSVEL